MASKRILVVDDDSYVREATEEILRRKQYNVDTATDGKAALAKLDDADYDPAAHAGISYRVAMGRIHAITGSGEVLRDVAVFREAYRLIGLGWLYAPTRWPLIGSVVDWVYGIWAARRLQITGRADLETLCQGRCELN